MVAKQTPGMTGNKISKEERRNAAREKARLLREQEEKRARRNKIFIIAGIIVAIVVVALAVYKIISSANSHDTGEYNGKVRSAKLQNVTAEYGIPVNKDGAATANPNKDVPNVGIFADLMCSHCVMLENSSAQTYREYMQNGTVQIVNYPVQIMNADFSKLGTAALFYIATYAPEQYDKFHSALFERAYKIIYEQTAQMPTAGEIADIAKQTGAADDVVEDLPASITSEEWQKEVEKATEKFRNAGWTGTPTVTVDGKENKDWGNGGMKAVFEKLVQKGK